MFDSKNNYIKHYRNLYFLFVFPFFAFFYNKLKFRTNSKKRKFNKFEKKILYNNNHNNE